MLLDVYKRQVPAVVITSRNKDGINNAFTVAWTGTICTNPPMPVSYTHLDVYKRQTLEHPDKSTTDKTDNIRYFFILTPFLYNFS